MLKVNGMKTQMFKGLFMNARESMETGKKYVLYRQS